MVTTADRPRNRCARFHRTLARSSARHGPPARVVGRWGSLLGCHLRFQFVERVPDDKSPASDLGCSLGAAVCPNDKTANGAATEEQQIELAGAVVEHHAIRRAASVPDSLSGENCASHHAARSRTNLAHLTSNWSPAPIGLLRELEAAHRSPARASLSWRTLT